MSGLDVPTPTSPVSSGPVTAAQLSLLEVYEHRMEAEEVQVPSSKAKCSAQCAHAGHYYISF